METVRRTIPVMTIPLWPKGQGVMMLLSGKPILIILWYPNPIKLHLVNLLLLTLFWKSTGLSCSFSSLKFLPLEDLSTASIAQLHQLPCQFFILLNIRKPSLVYNSIYTPLYLRQGPWTTKFNLTVDKKLVALSIVYRLQHLTCTLNVTNPIILNWLSNLQVKSIPKCLYPWKNISPPRCQICIREIRGCGLATNQN